MERAGLSTVCLSIYSITENIYYSQLSSVAILLQPEPVSHRIIQGNDCFLSLCAIVLRSPPASQCLLPTVSHRIVQGNDCFLTLCAIVLRSPPASQCLLLTVSHRIVQGNDFLSLCAIVLRSPLASQCLLLTVSEARSYFASTIGIKTGGRTRRRQYA
jgi:hypothetical protein